MAAEWLRQYSSSSISKSPSIRRKTTQIAGLGEDGSKDGIVVDSPTTGIDTYAPSSYPDSIVPDEDLRVGSLSIESLGSSRPIDVLSQDLSTRAEYGEIDTGLATEGDESSLDMFMKRRRSSITFDPKVRLDGQGEADLKKPSAPKLHLKTRPLAKPALDETGKHKTRPRTLSENDSQEYDPVTGVRLDDEYEHAQQRLRSAKYKAHQPRWPLLQSTVDELAHAPPEPDLAMNLSLTSKATLSPEVDEVKTPDTDAVVSPINISAPNPLWGSVPQDVPKRLTTRSKSYAIPNQRSNSIRVSRASRRATGGSASASPASAFLARYIASSPVAQPDDEGQEIGDYVLGREIGFGGFSIIREAYKTSGSEKIIRAVKIVRKNITGREEQDNDNLQVEFEREIEIWRNLSHNNILPLYAVYNTDFATFAITQLNTGGTLFDLVRVNRSGLSPHLIKHYAFQLASALRYLHEDMHIIHRDIKLENCLVDMTGDNVHEIGGKLLLCDFGLADYEPADSIDPAREAYKGSHASGTGIDPRTPSTASWLIGPAETSTNFAGSLPYAAPELLEYGQGVLSASIDMWAYGVVLYALTIGRLPFTHSFTPRLTTMIISGEWDKEGLRAKEESAADTAYAAPDSHTYNPNPLGGLSELIERCMELDPLGRWDIQDVLCSQWLQDEVEKAEDEHEDED